MEAVDQLASAGTFRVVKEPLAFLRVLEWQGGMYKGEDASRIIKERTQNLRSGNADL